MKQNWIRLCMWFVLFHFALIILLHFASFLFIFASDFCCFASKRNKRKHVFFCFLAKHNFHFDFNFRF